ncbi:MAG: acetylglucosaminylphosphatidylinositol deacetylase [Ilumatobacteraceae bacterium]|nr:acetylglucosaminylphosphatidylinositol deacetylase [Ilumatobacteraceae bacterium]
MMPTIDLALAGPTEQAWDEVCSTLPSFEWPGCDRLVVVSPHPDDETLGAGGLIATAVQRGLPVTVLAVTDGEAASPAPDLADVRAAELAGALGTLGPAGSIEHRRLRFPDGALAGSVDALVEVLGTHLRRTDLVVCPLVDDGHPDHSAVCDAATRSAHAVGAEVHWFPVWAWHCHDPERSRLRNACRLELAPATRSRKRRAMASYVSQLEGDEPVVPTRMLARLDRPYEVLVTPW